MSAAKTVEELLLKIRQAGGQPATRDQWRVVVIQLIRCSDEVLELIRDNCRQVGVGWLHPVVDAMLLALKRGEAVRENGFVLFRDKPRDNFLGQLFNPGGN
jgi:hypothetical protein